MNGFTYIERKDCFECDACGAEVQRGIANISNHWAECSGKQFCDSLFNKRTEKQYPLTPSDVEELIKNELG